MDPRRFDTFAKSLTTHASRRRALAGVFAGLVAAVAGAPAGVAKKKKKKNKKKKKPAPCSPACAGKTCGADGCTSICGACPTGESCVSGNCVADSGTCTLPCTGGRTCQPNGQCTCPPERPHAAPEQFCNETCRECCIDRHCHPTKVCDHTLGSICRCTGFGHRDCGGGFCSQCCTAEDCIADHNFIGGNVICTAPGSPEGGGLCRCAEGLALCGGDPHYCANVNDDESNCGQCGRQCVSQTCINGVCTSS